jgi:EAL and modified HD-GYP domain-containing signal transduction protein
VFSKLRKLFGLTVPAASPPMPIAAANSTPACAEEMTAAVASDGFLRREAVFDRAGRLTGRLFAVQGAPLAADESGAPHPSADSELIATLHASAEAWNTALAFVPLASPSLFDPTLDAIRAHNLVLLVHLTAAPTESIDALCARIVTLRRRGIAIAIFRQPKHPAFSETIRWADYGAIDVAASEPGSVRDFSAAFRAGPRDHEARLFACNIDTLDEHHLCHQWHFDYFHGAFAASAPLRDDEAATDPHKVQLLHILRLLQGNAETAEIVEAMKQDPPLAFRILRYLNSPLLGLDHKIESLAQALTILGRQRLTRWLSVLLFSVRAPSFGDWLLVESALTRGRLMEVLGAKLMPGEPADALFLTGIFSCLDKLLRRPLAQLVDEVPLSAEVRSALLERNGPYAKLLNLAEAAEAFDFAAMEKAAKALDIPADSANHALLAATAWASEVSEHWE